MYKKDKHEVSNAINILNSGIDTKICKGHRSGTNGDHEKDDGKCQAPESSDSSLTGLSKRAGGFGPSHTKASEKVGQYTSVQVSKDTSELSREEKGVVSSVFAKVIEGAEILEIRSISTAHT